MTQQVTSSYEYRTKYSGRGKKIGTKRQLVNLLIQAVQHEWSTAPVKCPYELDEAKMMNMELQELHAYITPMFTGEVSLHYKCEITGIE